MKSFDEIKKKCPWLLVDNNCAVDLRGYKCSIYMCAPMHFLNYANIDETDSIKSDIKALAKIMLSFISEMHKIDPIHTEEVLKNAGK